MDALDLKQCTMRETVHLNGGSEFFGYVLVCNEHPRLQRILRSLSPSGMKNDLLIWFGKIGGLA